ncbi:hypothetical protein JAAARDRAFT_189015 [Jaapia argillacea MUCL 33604]|uniref:Uncharacterized protein n=1 Tax=Jaapia argillacea MUCL 33604 TaxID=933084 RepID=A0A067Q8U1_9AGAM|nr:hypothetical protein JAAARDRAFT_189015 [Jaapia argillacea MUCL 33604]
MSISLSGFMVSVEWVSMFLGISGLLPAGRVREGEWLSDGLSNCLLCPSSSCVLALLFCFNGLYERGLMTNFFTEAMNFMAKDDFFGVGLVSPSTTCSMVLSGLEVLWTPMLNTELMYSLLCAY